MKVIKHLLLLLITLSVTAMDEPAHLKKIYVGTSDGQIVPVDRWQIDQMKTLLVLLEHQKGSNSVEKPLQATMINSIELQLLCDALTSILLGGFIYFYNDLVQEGRIRTLVNAAERIQATGVSAFCLSYIIPSDVQKALLVPQLVDSIIRMFPITYQTLAGHSDIIKTVDFSSDGIHIVSGSFGDRNNLILWDINNPIHITHQILPAPHPTLPNLIQQIRAGHSNDVYAVAFSADNTHIVSGSKGGHNNLILWNINNLSNPQVLYGCPHSVNTVAFSPDGTHIVSGSDGNQNNLILWDISNPHHITHQVLVGHPNNVNAVAFSPDGIHIASGCKGDQNNLILWNISNPHHITHQILAGYPDSVKTVAFSPDGTHIVSGSYGEDNNLILWNISNPNAILHQVLASHHHSVYTVAFSPDGTKIVSGSLGHNDLILWDISNPLHITHQILAGHPDSVYTVAFSPDGTHIVSGSLGYRNNLILWDISNPLYITHQILAGNPDNVYTVAFSPDGTKIVSGSLGHNNLILYQLISLTEKNALLNCNFAQAQFLYQLCLASQRGFSIQLTSPYATGIFKEMPSVIQQLLKKRLGITPPSLRPKECKGDCVIF